MDFAFVLSGNQPVQRCKSLANLLKQDCARALGYTLCVCLCGVGQGSDGGETSFPRPGARRPRVAKRAPGSLRVALEKG